MATWILCCSLYLLKSSQSSRFSFPLSIKSVFKFNFWFIFVLIRFFNPVFVSLSYTIQDRLCSCSSVVDTHSLTLFTVGYIGSNHQLHTNHSNLVSQVMGSSWANLTSPTVLPRQHNFDGSLKIFRIHQQISLMGYTPYVGLAAHSYGMDLLFTCNCFFYTCNPSHYGRK